MGVGDGVTDGWEVGDGEVVDAASLRVVPLGRDEKAPNVITAPRSAMLPMEMAAIAIPRVDALFHRNFAETIAPRTTAVKPRSKERILRIGIQQRTIATAARTKAVVGSAPLPLSADGGPSGASIQKM